MLALHDLRISIDGVPVLEGNAEATDAPRVALVGEWSPLFRAATGDAEMARGCIEVFGEPLDVALRTGRFAVAPLELPSVPSWTTRQFLDVAASLSPRSQRSLDLAQEFGLLALLERKLGDLLPSELRVVGLLVAAIARPELVLIEAPFTDLDEAGQRLVQRTLERLGQTARLYVSFPTESARADSIQSSPAAEFFRSSVAIWVADRGRILAPSTPEPFPGGARCYRVSVLGPPGDFATRLEAAGTQVHPVARSLGAASHAQVTTFVLTLAAAQGSRDVLEAAAIANTLVVEWLPLVPALDASPGLGA